MFRIITIPFNSTTRGFDEDVLNKFLLNKQLMEINLDLEKLRILFRVCHVRKYVSPKQYEYISRMIDETGRMVGGWAKQS